jgi:Uma2 family endonuclease
MALALKKETCTYSDYLRYTEDDRFELIAGEVYDMSPAPSRRHQQICVELSRQIAIIWQAANVRSIRLRSM